MKVIVGEEVKTAAQGEVIGLFIEEKIPRGLTLEETVAEIKRQGGRRVRAPPVRSAALGARLRAPADDPRRRRRDRGLQSARGDRRLQRGGCAIRRQVPARRRAPARTPTSPRGSARCGSGCGTSTGRTSSCSRCATPTSSRSPTSLLYVQALKFLQTGPRRRPRASASRAPTCAPREAQREPRNG